MSGLVVGDTFGRYRIEGLLGQGGMARVYRALELGPLERVVALKVMSEVLSEDPEFQQRFLHEARIAANLHHPNVIPIYDFDDHMGVLFLVMQLVDGSDLAARIVADGVLTLEEVVIVGSQIGDALDFAHDQGVIHRDVKPANIMIERSPRNNQSRALLTDFGISRVTDETRRTKPGTILGSLPYVAPELLRGEPVDGRADVYAFGCVLFEALTGHQPYVRDNQLALFHAHLEGEIPRVSDFDAHVGVDVDEIIAKALSKRPADRWTTCGSLIDALGSSVTRPPSAPSAATSTTTPVEDTTTPPALAPVGPSSVRPVLADDLDARPPRPASERSGEPDHSPIAEVTAVAGPPGRPPLSRGPRPAGVAVAPVGRTSTRSIRVGAGLAFGGLVATAVGFALSQGPLLVGGAVMMVSAAAGCVALAVRTWRAQPSRSGQPQSDPEPQPVHPSTMRAGDASLVVDEAVSPDAAASRALLRPPERWGWEGVALRPPQRSPESGNPPRPPFIPPQYLGRRRVRPTSAVGRRLLYGCFGIVWIGAALTWLQFLTLNSEWNASHDTSKDLSPYLLPAIASWAVVAVGAGLAVFWFTHRADPAKSVGAGLGLLLGFIAVVASCLGPYVVVPMAVLLVAVAPPRTKRGLSPEWERTRSELLEGYSQAYRAWQQRIVAYDQEERVRYDTAPTHFPAAPLTNATATFVVGGTPDSWELVLACVGSSWIGLGCRTLIVNLSRADPAGLLARIARPAGFELATGELSDLLWSPEGVSWDEVVDMVCDFGTSVRTASGARDRLHREDRAVLTRVARVLDDDDVSAARMSAAVSRVLDDNESAPDRALRDDELQQLDRLFSRRHLDHDSVMNSFLRIQAVLEDLSFLDATHLDEPRKGDAPRALRDFSGPALILNLLETSPSAEMRVMSEAVRRQRADVAVVLLIHALRRQATGIDQIVVIGADSIDGDRLEDLHRACVQVDATLTVFLEHLRDDAPRLLGIGGGRTVFCTLSNHREAAEATEYIGTQVTWMLAQPAGGNRPLGPHQPDNRSDSRQKSRPFGRSGADLEIIATEHVVNPEALMGLSAGVGILVEHLPGGHRAVRGVDFDLFRLALDPRVSSSARLPR